MGAVRGMELSRQPFYPPSRAPVTIVNSSLPSNPPLTRFQNWSRVGCLPPDDPWPIVFGQLLGGVRPAYYRVLASASIEEVGLRLLKCSAASRNRSCSWWETIHSFRARDPRSSFIHYNRSAHWPLKTAKLDVCPLWLILYLVPNSATLLPQFRSPGTHEQNASSNR